MVKQKNKQKSSVEKKAIAELKKEIHDLQKQVKAEKLSRKTKGHMVAN